MFILVDIFVILTICNIINFSIFLLDILSIIEYIKAVVEINLNRKGKPQVIVGRKTTISCLEGSRVVEIT